MRTQLRRKLYQERLRSTVSSAVELAVTDPLTGLYNRRYLDAHLASAVARASATEKPVCVLIFDIDHFKAINDTYGHDAGDDVLKDFSDRLQKRRARHRPCRPLRRRGVHAGHAGDRRGVRERRRGAAQMRRGEGAVRHAVAARNIPVTVSIGIAEWRGASDSADALIKRADEALYAAKHAGRNRVVASAA